MKNSLHLVSLFLAAGIPTTVLAEFVGAHAPVALDPENMVSAFAIVVTLLTVIADYSRAAKPLAASAPSPTARITSFPRQDVSERRAA